MGVLLNIGMMLAALAMIKYRERIGDFLGEAQWMRNVGGVYNVIVILAVVLFFWSVASLTGTEHILFAPVFWVLGGALK